MVLGTHTGGETGVTCEPVITLRRLFEGLNKAHCSVPIPGYKARVDGREARRKDLSPTLDEDRYEN